MDQSSLSEGGSSSTRVRLVHCQRRACSDILQQPWHEVLHEANAYSLPIASPNGLETFSTLYARHQWRWAGKMMQMEPMRWATRLSDWNPAMHGHRGRRGRQHLCWRDGLDDFWRWRQPGRFWETAAATDQQL